MAARERRGKAWKKAGKGCGADPNPYCQDPYGNIMCEPSYCEHSDMGWGVDHINPKVTARWRSVLARPTRKRVGSST
jgi:hypothetical protein